MFVDLEGPSKKLTDTIEAELKENQCFVLIILDDDGGNVQTMSNIMVSDVCEILHKVAKKLSSEVAQDN